VARSAGGRHLDPAPLRGPRRAPGALRPRPRVVRRGDHGRGRSRALRRRSGGPGEGRAPFRRRLMALATTRRVVAVEPRGVPTLWVRLASPVIAIIGAGLAGAVLLLATGHDPLPAYRSIVRASFGNKFGWMSTLISATPLILTAVSAAVAFRMRVWNIGQEGQLYLGAIAASGIALALGDHVVAPLALPVVLPPGVVGGAAWAAIAAFPRAYLRTDEVISTLMLNFIALYLMNYLIFGSVSFWRDTERITFPSGRLIPDAAELPNIWLRLHLGFLI